MSSFAKFLAKYSSEAFSIASAFSSVLDGLALAPKENAKVKAVIEKLEAASASLAFAAAKEDKAPVVKISKADIEAAVTKVLEPMVKKAVEAALKAKDNA